MIIGRSRLASLYPRSAASVALSKSAGAVKSPISIHCLDHSPKRASCAFVSFVIFFTTNLFAFVTNVIVGFPAVNSFIDFPETSAKLIDMSKPRTNLDGLALVLELIQKQQAFATSYGVKSWLATKLGVTRQTILNWEDRDGVPRESVSAVSKLTGLSVMQIRPEDVGTNIPADLWVRIAARAERMGKSFSDVVVASLRKDYR
jgi:hypothetical protein